MRVYEAGPGYQRGGRYVDEYVRTGEDCSDADDPAACPERVADLASDTSCAQSTTCRFAIIGRGDEYERINRREQLITLLGSIDPATDTLLLADFDGRRLCPGVRVDPRDVGTDVRATPQGYELRITRAECSGDLYRDRLEVAADGTLTLVSHTVLGSSMCVIGRRPVGLRGDAGFSSSTRLGAFLVQAAHLEAAVHAFHQLVGELGRLGAPESLHEAALDAMLDEIRHAREMGELARGYGGTIATPEVASSEPRSAYALALDNVGESCVREPLALCKQPTRPRRPATHPRSRSRCARPGTIIMMARRRSGGHQTIILMLKRPSTRAGAIILMPGRAVGGLRVIKMMPKRPSTVAGTIILMPGRRPAAARESK